MMQNMFMAWPMQRPPITCSPTPESQEEEEATQISSEDQFHSFVEQVTFNSNLSSDDELISDNAQPPRSEVNMGVQNKQHRLDVPYWDQRKRKQEATAKEGLKALVDLEKLMKSKKIEFVGGIRGLQARQTNAIESHLRLVIKNGHPFMDASEMAAESNGFAPKWRGRQVCSWTKLWIRTRDLPKSLQGKHAKVYSLLSDPTVAAELWTYVHSNKWAMDPSKLTQFTSNKLVSTAPDQYLHHIIHEEMPHGLKKYVELELFPHIHLWVGHGILLSTACRWLHLEGFWYTSHKKGLYFDGHDRPNVTAYCQDHFLPFMKTYKSHLIHYIDGDVENELQVQPLNFVEHQLVLCAHDEATSQVNDSKGKSWVFRDQHPLWKKGAGHGLHQSDVVCSTVRWLREASQTLEYGKNYNGYWNREMFIKQVFY